MPKPGTVLVVDDHEPSLCGLRDLLQQHGYAVWTSDNGADGLATAARERPDLVLLDVVMPGQSGIEICGQLKKHPATYLIPVVLLSAVRDRDARLAGVEAGADDFLAKPVDAEELYARVRSLIRLKRLTDELESAEALFLTLGRIIEARDPYTEGHCERLACYATALGTAMKLDDRDIHALYRGAFLHDIGKIATPDRLLLKKAPLTPSEFVLMQRHPVTGDELCRTVRSLESVRPIVRHHHERLDGSGYPDGLAGANVPLLAQIVAVVDVFDALTTDRPYRRALTPAEAYDTLRRETAAGWRDTAIVEAFIALHHSGRALPASVAPPRPRRRPAAKPVVVVTTAIPASQRPLIPVVAQAVVRRTEALAADRSQQSSPRAPVRPR